MIAGLLVSPFVFSDLAYVDSAFRVNRVQAILAYQITLKIGTEIAVLLMEKNQDGVLGRVGVDGGLTQYSASSTKPYKSREAE